MFPVLNHYDNWCAYEKNEDVWELFKSSSGEVGVRREGVIKKN